MGKNETAELISSVAELVGALKSDKACPAEKEKAREERVRSLQLAIEEQRRDYDLLERLYERAKVKIITFIAAGFALLTYLYGNVPDGQVTLVEKLFIPDEPYGVIIYSLSLIFIIALAVLIFALKARSWRTAYDNEQEGSLINDNTYEYYLRYMQKMYLRCSSVNSAAYAKQQILLNMSFLPLLLGGTLLVLLKTFGG